jgi:hypothetical protein
MILPFEREVFSIDSEMLNKGEIFVGVFNKNYCTLSI